MNKYFGIIFVFVVMLVSMCQLCTAQTMPTKAEDLKHQFKDSGTYDKRGFGKEYWIYRFDKSQTNAVLYQIGDSIFLYGDDGGQTGKSYVSVYLENAEFIAISKKHMLFLTQEGMIAVELKNHHNAYDAEKIPHGSLTLEDRCNFIYPVKLELVTN